MLKDASSRRTIWAKIAQGKVSDKLRILPSRFLTPCLRISRTNLESRRRQMLSPHLFYILLTDFIHQLLRPKFYNSTQKFVLYLSEQLEKEGFVFRHQFCVLTGKDCLCTDYTFKRTFFFLLSCRMFTRSWQLLG